MTARDDKSEELAACILIVDSDAGTIETCRRFLSPHAHTVISTYDSWNAMRLLRASGPDIVVTEVVMPEKDGIELLLEIKKTAPHVKVIAMSGGGGAMTSEFALHMARKLGADSVLAKPFNADQLRAAIADVLFHQPRHRGHD